MRRRRLRGSGDLAPRGQGAPRNPLPAGPPERGAAAHGDGPGGRGVAAGPALARAGVPDRQRLRPARCAQHHAGNLRAAEISPRRRRKGAEPKRQLPSRRGYVSKDLSALQERYPDVEIGSYPYFRRGDFGVTLVLRGTDRERLALATDALKTLIRKLGGDPQDGLSEG